MVMIDIEGRKLGTGSIVLMANDGELKNHVILGITKNGYVKISCDRRFYYNPTSYIVVGLTLFRIAHYQKHNDVMYVYGNPNRFFLLGTLDLNKYVEDMQDNRSINIQEAMRRVGASEEKLNKYFTQKNLENLLL